MGFIKNIARKILTDEIKDIKDNAKWYEKRNIELRGEMIEKQIKLAGEKAELEKEISKLQLEKSEQERKTSALENENEILRKYYDLDKEPSDEIKAKIHIDLEINRLKEENLKLIAMRNQVSYTPVPMPYTSYWFGGLRM